MKTEFASDKEYKIDLLRRKADQLEKNAANALFENKISKALGKATYGAIDPFANKRKKWQRKADELRRRAVNMETSLSAKDSKVTEYDKFNDDIRQIRLKLDSRYGIGERGSEAYQNALKAKTAQRLKEFKTGGKAMMIYHKEMESKKLELMGQDEATIRAELKKHSEELQTKIASNLQNKGTSAPNQGKRLSTGYEEAKQKLAKAEEYEARIKESKDKKKLKNCSRKPILLELMQKI